MRGYWKNEGTAGPSPSGKLDKFSVYYAGGRMSDYTRKGARDMLPEFNEDIYTHKFKIVPVPETDLFMFYSARKGIRENLGIMHNAPFDTRKYHRAYSSAEYFRLVNSDFNNGCLGSMRIDCAVCQFVRDKGNSQWAQSYEYVRYPDLPQNLQDGKMLLDFCAPLIKEDFDHEDLFNPGKVYGPGGKTVPAKLNRKYIGVGGCMSVLYDFETERNKSSGLGFFPSFQLTPNNKKDVFISTGIAYGDMGEEYTPKVHIEYPDPNVDFFVPFGGYQYFNPDSSLYMNTGYLNHLYLNYKSGPTTIQSDILGSIYASLPATDAIYNYGRNFDPFIFPVPEADKYYNTPSAVWFRVAFGGARKK